MPLSYIQIQAEIISRKLALRMQYKFKCYEVKIGKEITRTRLRVMGVEEKGNNNMISPEVGTPQGPSLSPDWFEFMQKREKRFSAKDSGTKPDKFNLPYPPLPSLPQQISIPVRALDEKMPAGISNQPNVDIDKKRPLFTWLLVLFWFHQSSSPFLLRISTKLHKARRCMKNSSGFSPTQELPWKLRHWFLEELKQNYFTLTNKGRQTH